MFFQTSRFIELKGFSNLRKMLHFCKPGIFTDCRWYHLADAEPVVSTSRYRWWQLRQTRYIPCVWFGSRFLSL